MAFNLNIRAWIEPVKWILGADVDDTWQPVADMNLNALLLSPSRLLLVQNASDGDIMISLDAGATWHVPILKGSAAVIDIQANKTEPAGSNAVPQNTVFWMTALSSVGTVGMAPGPFAAAGFTDPTTGAIFVTSFYGR